MMKIANFAVGMCSLGMNQQLLLATCVTATGHYAQTIIGRTAATEVAVSASQNHHAPYLI
jgi:hypothetical protein